MKYKVYNLQTNVLEILLKMSKFKIKLLIKIKNKYKKVKLFNLS